jgi:hypothetical protein
MHYKGICHCGNAVFEIPAATAGAASSYRPSRPDDRSFWRIPRDLLRLLGAEEGIGVYTFSGRMVGHRFCGTCGMHLYGEEIGDEDPPMAYVNRDCLEEPQAE